MIKAYESIIKHKDVYKHRMSIYSVREIKETKDVP